MAKPKSQSARPSAKPSSKPGPKKTASRKTSPGVSADPGEAAFLQLKTRLAKLAAERIVQPRTDVRAAASHVLSDTVPRLADKSLRARFTALPAAEFDHGALDALPLAAQAALWTQSEQTKAAAAAPGARLDVALFTEATELRRAMLSVCEYHFRSDPRLYKQVEDIRSGTGYLDLAEDLSRLAALYRAEAATLKQDLRFYRAGDAASAVKLSQRIYSELRKESSAAAQEIAWRAWALLVELYDEVARAGRFLLRQDGETAFPALHALGRSAPRRREAQAPTPPVPG